MAELHLNTKGSCVVFHSGDRQKAVLLRSYGDRIKHLCGKVLIVGGLPKWLL